MNIEGDVVYKLSYNGKCNEKEKIKKYKINIKSKNSKSIRKIKNIKTVKVEYAC